MVQQSQHLVAKAAISEAPRDSTATPYHMDEDADQDDDVGGDSDASGDGEGEDSSDEAVEATADVQMDAENV